MNKDWQKHLEQNGALIENHTVQRYNSPNIENAGIASEINLVDLSHLGLIQASGVDTEEFLQGQLTNDVRLVNHQASQLNAYCSPKGRILACFRLFMMGEDYYLDFPRSLLESTIKRLQMFILRSNVTLKDASDTFVRFGLMGDNSPMLLQDTFDAIPHRPNEVLLTEGITVICLPGPATRFEIHGETKKLIPLWDRLKETAQPAGAGSWSLLDIQAGIPTITPEIADIFVPQMLNLQALDGVSFKKGCYTGQEIVARMQYLGALKRRMYRAHIDTPEIPQATPRAGDDLYSSATKNQQSKGKIVAAQANPEGGVELLAVIQIATAQADDVHLSHATGIKLNLLELPYPINRD